jgi:hypothetical protein
MSPERDLSKQLDEAVAYARADRHAIRERLSALALEHEQLLTLATQIQTTLVGVISRLDTLEEAILNGVRKG